MSVDTSANRILLVRDLIRDTNTVRPFFTDAVIGSCLHEALVDYDSLVGTVDESQSATFLVTDRTKALTYIGAVDDVIGVRLSSVNGPPLSIIDFWQVRRLQESEGRVGTPEVAGLQLTALASSGGATFNLAIYPFAAVTVYVACHTFKLAEPAGYYPDLNGTEAAYVVRKAALTLAGLAAADESIMETIEAPIEERYLAGIGLRRTHGAPGVQNLDDVLTAIRTEG